MIDVETFKLVGMLASLAGVICGSAVYFMRNSASRLETSFNRLFQTVSDSHNELKEDVRDLATHFDEKIDKMHGKIDISNKELRENFLVEISQLKTTDMTLSEKLEKNKDQLNDIDKRLLEYKLEANEKFLPKDQQK